MKQESPRNIELLSPAANADIAMEAILHGADAVYMGGPGHGARKAAANSIDDIKRVADFAHIFGAKVYITVNTIIYESELKEVEKMIGEIYRAGADAIIVQDMAILRLDIPPVQLHASTQCDIRTPEKALFLQQAGFSQLVLARELTLQEISDITEVVKVPVECFVHGALCVSYSGRCHASFATTGRSANRGECAQICRLPYSLMDGDGKIIIKERHLLSLKDFNANAVLADMLEAGVSSFKIEGRLKDASYVKNITAYYRNLIDEIIRLNPNKYKRSSYGDSTISFDPNPEKSFNRGFTTYFLENRTPKSLSSPLTPKSLGEEIRDVNQLHNGDGISYFDNEGNYKGVMVNGVRNGKIIGNRPFQLPKGAVIHRTSDIEWQKLLAKPTAVRKLMLDVRIDKTGISAKDETGAYVRIPLKIELQKAEKPMDFRKAFDKFGNTVFSLRNFNADDLKGYFVPASLLAERRRELTETLLTAKRSSYQFPVRSKEEESFAYPATELDFRDNVANSKAAEFYLSHRVKTCQPALEARKGRPGKDTVVMTTRHCILRDNGMCLKQKGKKIKLPLTIASGNMKFTLDFDCKNCEMKVKL